MPGTSCFTLCDHIESGTRRIAADFKFERLDVFDGLPPLTVVEPIRPLEVTWPVKYS
jgi:hypothetical protein